METIYAIIDRNSGAYLKPLMVERNDVVPVRTFMNAWESKDSMINRYPEDFELVALATIDTELYTIEPLQPHRVVAKAIDFAKNKQ